MTQTPSLFDETRPRLLYLTNRVNVLEVLARRLLVARSAYDDDRYYPDLLELCPGRIPLLSAVHSEELLARVEAGGASAFPTILEIDPALLATTTVPAIGQEGPTNAALGAAGIAAWAPAAPIPLAVCRALHFRSATELEEHRLRRYENVLDDAVALEVTPELFAASGDTPSPVAWLSGLEPIDEGDVDLLDRVSGALTMIAATLPASENAVKLLRDLLGTAATRKRPRASIAPFAPWLIAMTVGPRRAANTNEKLFTAVAQVFAEVTPAVQWRPLEVLDKNRQAASRMRLPKDDLDDLARVFDYIGAVIGNETDFQPFHGPARLPVGRALLLALMRPDPVEFLAWAVDETGADNEVWITAAALTGLLAGRKRLPTKLRPCALDDHLARIEAALGAPRDSVAPAPDQVQISKRKSLAQLRLRHSKTMLLERTLLDLPLDLPAEPAAEHVDPILNDAMTFALAAHGQRIRKGTTYPFAVHPFRVGEILARHGCSLEVIAAGVLHDVLDEDSTDRSSLGASFGDRVALLVERAANGVQGHRDDAKAAQLDARCDALVAESDEDVLLIAAADELDNIRSIHEMLVEQGSAAATAALGQQPEAYGRYFRRLAEELISRNERQPLFQLLQLEAQAAFPAPSAVDARLFHAQPLAAPEQARPFLADPKIQWKKGRSAYELAHRWIGTPGIPEVVRTVLDTDETFRGCELAEGLFERQVGLRTPGGPSQTDLLLLLRLREGHAVIAVEGKAGEPFGKMVREWNDGEGKERRLQALCEALQLERALVDGLRYQLLHRTVSALFEAQRYGATEAVMLVHAFDEDDRSFADFRLFADALNIPLTDRNRLSSPRLLDHVALRLGWVQDAP